MKLLAACLACALLAGCGAPQRVLSPHQASALEWNQRGLEAFQAGRYPQAQAAFEQALAQERSVENEDGIALNLVNLSQALQRQGKVDEAGKALDAMLNDGVLAYPAARRADALLQKAVLALQARDGAGAGTLVARAQAVCANTCAAAAKLLNLEARLSLERGDAASALRAAGAALAKNRDAKDEAEIANSLRLMAAAHLRQGAAVLALPLATEALALDKRLGESEKIFQDLLLLGHASADGQLRRSYWLRAQGVARAAGNAQSLRDVDVLLN